MFDGSTGIFAHSRFTGGRRGFLFNYQTMLADEDVRFQIERIPPGLNFIDLMNFRNMTTSTISGNIIKIFTLKEYLVYLYTEKQVRHSGRVLLLEKIEFLRSIIPERIECELWIIKDCNYACIGIFNLVPVFIKHLNSMDEINDHIQLLIENMNMYAMLQNIRFFCCDSNGFSRNKVNVFEYSPQFMSDIMSGYTSISEYCKETQRKKLVKRKKNRWGTMLSALLLGFSIVMYQITRVVKRKTKAMIERVSMLNGQGITLPTQEHYEQIQELEQELNEDIKQGPEMTKSG